MKVFINTLMLVATSILFLLYSYYYNKLIIAIGFFVILFLFILIFKIFKITIKQISQIIIKYLSLKKQYTIKLKNLFFIIPIFTIAIANVFLITDFINSLESFKFNDFIFYEINIIQKIFSIYLFYALIILLVYAIGKKILKLFKFNFNNKLTKFLFSIGLGFIPFMFCTFFIALLGLLYNWTIWILIILLIIFSVKEILRIFKEINNTKIILSFENYFNSIKSFIWIILSVILIFNFIIILKPIPVTTDDLHTYFNAPYLYTQYHKFKPLMHERTANMGQNTEMIYASIISIVGEKFIIHFQFMSFIFCLIGFYLLLQTIFDKKYAILGVLTIFLVPWNFFYINTVKVEMFLSFYSMLMLYAFFLYYKNSSNNYLYLIGILSGISIGIKYNALLFIVPLYFILLIIIIIRKKKLKVFLLSCLLCLIFFAPWAIKNQIYFNNIFYPIQKTKIFQNNKQKIYFPTSKEYIENRGKEIKYIRHAQEYNKYNLINIIKLAYNQSIGKIDQGGWVNFGFIPLLIMPFYFLYYKNKKFAILLSITIFYFMLWYIMEGARAWYAFFGFIMLYALLPYLFFKNKKFAYLYLLIMFLLVILNTSIVPHNINYLFGKENKELYIYNNIPYYETAKFINNLKLNNQQKILLLGDLRTAFINKNDEIMYTDSYLGKITYSLNKSDKYFKNILKKNNFNYIIYSKTLDKFYYGWPIKTRVSRDEYSKKYNKKTPNFYQDVQILRNFLENNTQLIFDDGYYRLYKL